MSCKVALHVGAVDNVSLEVGGVDVQALEVGAAVIETPPYQGEYSVTPTNTAQTLSTAGCALRGDITIEAIPSNYGLITYNGSIITVS